MGLRDIHRFFATHELTRADPALAWRRFLSWQLSSRLKSEQVVDWVGGAKLAVRRGMRGATGNIYVGLHEFSEMAFVLHFLRPQDVFYDIGANVGTYSVLASGVVGATTFAFEPDAQNLAFLKRNISLNALESRVTPMDCALSDRPGEGRFTASADTIGHVVDGAGGEGGTVSVRLETVDRFARRAQPALMKIDVEGHEEKVLRGAAQALASPELKAIEIETVDGAIRALLESHGFRQHSYDPRARAIAASDAKAGSNHFYLRDVDYVRRRVAEAPAFTVLGATI